MIALAIKNFLRSKVAVASLLFILLAGIVSIHIGKQFLQKQEAAIAKTAAFQKEHIHRNVQFFDKEIGLLLYYLKFSLVNKPSNLNALSIGQRDVNVTIQSVTIKNLEAQKYDTDLYNPSNLLAGNLDYSFVLIYLFPLLIIALSYNLLSEEKEGETWRLISVQAKNPLRYLWQKLAIRAVAVYAALAVILGYAMVILSLLLNAAFIAVVCLSVMYIAFWFALSFWAMSWHKSSSVNAVSLLSFWMLLTIVCPAVANSYLINKYPVPEAMHTAIEQRDGYHEKWDMDKRITTDAFYTHYPQFKKYPLPNKQFSWLWYYAMQQMGDDDAKEQATAMQKKLRLREQVSNNIARPVPTIFTQLQLNNLTHSGLSNHLDFLDSTNKFHEKMRLYFYPKIFEEAAVNEQDWHQWQVEYFGKEEKVKWIKLLLPLAILIVVLLVPGYINLKRMKNM